MKKSCEKQAWKCFEIKNKLENNLENKLRNKLGNIFYSLKWRGKNNIFKINLKITLLHFYDGHRAV